MSVLLAVLAATVFAASSAERTVEFPANGTPQKNAAAVQAAVDAVSAASGS